MEERKKPLDRDAKENRAALSHYQGIQNGLATAMHITNNTTTTAESEQLAEALQAINDGIAGLGDFSSFHIKPEYYNEKRLANSTTALKAFNSTELLELILLHASHSDVMCMRKVSRHFKDTIDGSSKLQIKLGLKAAQLESGKMIERPTLFPTTPDPQSFYVRLRPPQASTMYHSQATATFHVPKSTGRLPIIGTL